MMIMMMHRKGSKRNFLHIKGNGKKHHGHGFISNVAWDRGSVLSKRGVEKRSTREGTDVVCIFVVHEVYNTPIAVIALHVLVICIGIYHWKSQILYIIHYVLHI